MLKLEHAKFCAPMYNILFNNNSSFEFLIIFSKEPIHRNDMNEFGTYFDFIHKSKSVQLKQIADSRKQLVVGIQYT